MWTLKQRIVQDQSCFVEQETKKVYHASCQNRTDTFIYFGQGDPFSIHKQNTVINESPDYKSAII